jgi:nickel/cobalt transporter (NicO) family protein
LLTHFLFQNSLSGNKYATKTRALPLFGGGGVGCSGNENDQFVHSWYLARLRSIFLPPNNAFMNELLLAGLSISLLHAAIPNHWLPIIAIGRRSGWTAGKTVRITALAGSAHALSTILIGLLLSMVGWKMAGWVEVFSHVAAPVLLIGLGAIFIWRHYFHQHFHLHGDIKGELNETQLIFALALAMFLSPCLEIGAFFLVAGTHGASVVWVLSSLYFITTVAGMSVWVWLVWRGLSLRNWHALEHNAGIISGVVLVLSGLWGLMGWG